MAYRMLVQSHGADTITSRPERTPKQRSSGPHQFSVDPYRTLTLQAAYRHRDAVLRGYTQNHVNMIHRSVSFQQFDAFLQAQLSQQRTDPPSELTVQHFATVLGQDHYMVLALPLHMCLTSPVFHGGPPGPAGPSSWRSAFLIPPRTKRQSLLNSHRQRRWINYDLMLTRTTIWVLFDFDFCAETPYIKSIMLLD